MTIAYLVKKFPRLSETFVLGEILGQEALGTDVHVFARRAPDDEPRHAEFAQLRAPVEVLPSTHGMQPWLELFQSDPQPPDVMARMGDLVREFAHLEHPRLPMLFAEALYLLRRTRELSIDHVHTHFATDSAITAMLLAALGGPSYSVTAHAKDIYRSTVDSRLLSDIVARSAFTVTVCDANVRHLVKQLDGRASERVRRIYNGIDLQSFNFQPDGREPAYLLSTGRLVEKKGFDVFLCALALLQRRGVRFSAAIIGEGDQRAQLESLVAELGLAERVQLLGARDQDFVRSEMQRATAFCLPCRIGTDGNRDALPTVLLEALACGLPVVATPVTGIPEILDHGKAGRIVAEDDPLATADALQLLLANPHERRDLANHGRRHAEALFDRNTSARALNECFEQAFEGAACP